MELDIILQNPKTNESISLVDIQKDIDKMLPHYNGYGINLYYIQAMVNKIKEQHIELKSLKRNDNT